MMQSLIQADFHGQALTIIDHAGQKWLTAEQVGLALGYAEANARIGISNLYNRHVDEFTDQDSIVINLITNSRGNPSARIFSATGCQLLGFFANTTRAKAFRQWAKQVLAGVSPAQPPGPVPAIGFQGRITRELERRLLECFAYHPTSQKALAHKFGISAASCCSIIHGKYPFGPGAGVSQCSDALLDAVAARVLANEQARLQAYQQGIANRLRNTANNRALADRLDRIGQHLQQAPGQALLPMSLTRSNSHE